VADKQSLNATFFAFRKRERGGVLIGATVAYVVVALAFAAVFAVLNWRAFGDYFAWSMSMSANVGSYDPQITPMPASVMSLIPSYFLMLIVTYLLLASYESACLKWMIRGETGGVFGLSFDADMWRVWAGYWVWLLLLFAVYVVCAIVGVVLMGSIFAMTASAGGPSESGALSVILVGVTLGFLVAAMFVYFSVRFAPAAATSIARRRFSFFQAWTVTKGRFWAMLGSFVLLFVMYFVGYIILYGFGVFLVFGSLLTSAASGGEPSSEDVVRAFSAPGVWIPLLLIYVLAIVGTFLWLVAVFGVNARAATLALEEGKITQAAS
jgi:hypothetical protein